MISKRDRIGRFPGCGLFPFMEIFDGDKAAPLLEGLAEGRLALNPFGLGVDVEDLAKLETKVPCSTKLLA